MTRPKTREDVLSPATLACLERVTRGTRKPMARQKRGHLDQLLEEFQSSVLLQDGSVEKSQLMRIAALKPFSIEDDINHALGWLLDRDERARQALLLSHLPRIFRILIKESALGEDWLDIFHDAICDAIAAVDNLEVYDYKSFSTNVGLAVLHRRTFRALTFTRVAAGPRSGAVRTVATRMLNFDIDAIREGKISAEEIDRAGQEPMVSETYHRVRDYLTGVDTDEMPPDSDDGGLVAIEAGVDAEKIQTILGEALDERARDIIVRRYMSDEREDADRIAADWSITPERVRQIERQSLIDLKASLENRKTDKQIRQERKARVAARKRQQIISRREPKIRTVKGVDLQAMRPQMKATLADDKIEVICRRYFTDETPPGPTMIAREMGISPSRVRRLEAAALNELAELQKVALASGAC